MVNEKRSAWKPDMPVFYSFLKRCRSSVPKLELKQHLSIKNNFCSKFRYEMLLHVARTTSIITIFRHGFINHNCICGKHFNYLRNWAVQKLSALRCLKNKKLLILQNTHRKFSRGRPDNRLLKFAPWRQKPSCLPLLLLKQRSCHMRAAARSSCSRRNAGLDGNIRWSCNSLLMYNGGRRGSVDFSIMPISGRSNLSVWQTVFLSDDKIWLRRASLPGLQSKTQWQDSKRNLCRCCAGSGTATQRKTS